MGIERGRVHLCTVAFSDRIKTIKNNNLKFKFS